MELPYSSSPFQKPPLSTLLSLSSGIYLIYSKKYAIDDLHFDSSILDVSIDFLVNSVK